jgi:hypothetical protein
VAEEALEDQTEEAEVVVDSEEEAAASEVEEEVMTWAHPNM